MKTIIYTSIYSNLYNTSFGGRASRNWHYKYSLLNILNMQANKYICFTSEEELSDLENFFYTQNNISKNLLNFIVFDLKNTKYYNNINRLKNLETIKTSQRCYEIQYNKFFWLDMIPDLESYDRVFWIDAGLSHSGLIPSQYSTSKDGMAKYFLFSLFNSTLLNKLNNMTDKKTLIFNKNNKFKFYWSNSIPKKYYLTYNNSLHTIGGCFGGIPSNLKWFKDEFDKLCINLLTNETNLYHEELIMSCIYFNNIDKFISLNFDDWYARDSHSGDVKLFYQCLL
jgi:hypothetical protein